MSGIIINWKEIHTKSDFDHLLILLSNYTDKNYYQIYDSKEILYTTYQYDDLPAEYIHLDGFTPLSLILKYANLDCQFCVINKLYNNYVYAAKEHNCKYGDLYHELNRIVRGKSLTQYALKYSCVAIMDKLIELGAKLDHEETPKLTLYYAIRYHNVKIATLLLKAGAKILNDPPNIYSPLVALMCCDHTNYEDHIEFIKHFIDQFNAEPRSPRTNSMFEKTLIYAYATALEFQPDIVIEQINKAIDEKIYGWVQINKEQFLNYILRTGEKINN